MANSKIAGLQGFDGIVERRCGGAGKAWISAREPLFAGLVST